MSRSPVLLLDVMDTLVHDPFYAEVPAFFGLDLPGLIAAKSWGVWEQFELGEIDEATLAARYFADGREFDLDGLRTCLARAYRFLPGMEALLVELGEAGVEMHALSNYPVWWQLIEAELRLSRYLEWSFVSARVGVRKPDPQAFLRAAEALGRPPAECLFIDDRAKNCAGAEGVGMPALRFVNASALREALRERGVLRARREGET